MIKINPSHKGWLHKILGMQMSKKIPVKKLKVKPSDSVKAKKEKIFAMNAKKWNKKN